MNYSVIIPLYNKASYVGETLQSIVNQTKWPNEIIVVDDCSTDNGLAVVEQFFEATTPVFRQHVRTLVISRKWNCGIGITRNVGLDHATGDVVTFLDGDDVYAPDFFERMAELFEEQGADMVTMRVKLFPSGIAYPNFGAVERYHSFIGNNAWLMLDPLKIVTSHQYVIGVGSNVVIRRKWMEKERFTETARFYEGIDCWYRQMRQIARSNGRIVQLQGNYLHVREVQGSASRGKFLRWDDPVFPPLLISLEGSKEWYDRDMRGLMRALWIVHSLKNMPYRNQRIRFVWHQRRQFVRQGLYILRRMGHFLRKGK